MSKGPFDSLNIYIPMGYENRVSKPHLVIAVFWGLKIFISVTIFGVPIFDVPIFDVTIFEITKEFPLQF